MNFTGLQGALKHGYILQFTAHANVSFVCSGMTKVLVIKPQTWTGMFLIKLMPYYATEHHHSLLD